MSHDVVFAPALAKVQGGKQRCKDTEQWPQKWQQIGKNQQAEKLNGERGYLGRSKCAHAMPTVDADFLFLLLVACS
jgi:hypothetical protein